ncbi:hypothetical protein [Novosphingobium sp. PhB55]|uniref:hypothetical protein n=1 Tax=Novosphingobium sp. PhB55 TaxID=2485106 RepID=UPI00141707C0|nr:hypothetical protein [Novosphingobium sp. PhB55]
MRERRALARRNPMPNRAGQTLLRVAVVSLTILIAVYAAANVVHIEKHPSVAAVKR